MIENDVGAGSFEVVLVRGLDPRACADPAANVGRRVGPEQELQDYAEQHTPRCQHNWVEHDVLVWDSESVEHEARGNFPVGESRRFWRYMLEGDAPA